MLPTAVILNHLLPVGAVDLGRLVLNVWEPSQDFYQPKLLERNILVQRIERFTDVLSQIKDSRLHGSLTAAFSTVFSTRKHSSTSISSSTCITRQLQNSNDYFLELCQLAKARAWMESAVRRNLSVFLVVGVKTLTDADIKQKEERLRERSVDVEVPVMTVASAAMAGAGMVLPLGDSLDPSLGKSRTRTFDTKSEYTAPGEHIYAVQYRKVRFRRFTSCKVDHSSLESGNRWKVYVGSRGSETGGDNDGIEASLSDPGKEQLTEGMGNSCEVSEVDGEGMVYLW